MTKTQKQQQMGLGKQMINKKQPQGGYGYNLY